MSDTTNNKGFADLVKERFRKLPSVVQRAITSAEVEQHLRALASTHKLHLDQWEILENEVQMTLLGIQPAEDLQKNITKEVGVDEETAKALTVDISKIVFEPIRAELERQLEHPEAKAAEVSGVEAARAAVLGGQKTENREQQIQPAVPLVVPATPPAPPPSEKSARAPVSESYKAGESSGARKSVHDDPYRESPQ